MALLEHFRRRRCTTFVATHYPELKSYAQLTPGVRNASVEFDTQTLSPTFRLTIGLPGRSNALTIARRLNMPEAVVKEARQMVSAEDLRTQDMLDDIHRLRMTMAQEREEAHSGRVAAKRTAEELRDRLESIDEERGEILEQARREAEETLETVRSEVRQLRRRLRAAAAPVEEVSSAEEELETLQKRVTQTRAVEIRHAPELNEHLEEHLRRPIVAGDTVWVRPLSAKGQVLRVDDGEAEVQVGRLRTQVDLAALELRAAEKGEPTPEGVKVTAAPAASPGRRIDFRGQTVEETMIELDRYLDRATRAGLAEVQVIHGKGTGALRRAVREALADHPLVRDFRGGGDREGGEGITLVELVRQ